MKIAKSYLSDNNNNNNNNKYFLNILKDFIYNFFQNLILP